jgi:hypothetical protein
VGGLQKINERWQTNLNKATCESLLFCLVAQLLVKENNTKNKVLGFTVSKKLVEKRQIQRYIYKREKIKFPSNTLIHGRSVIIKKKSRGDNKLPLSFCRLVMNESTHFFSSK